MIALVVGASEEAAHAINLAKKHGLEIWAYDNDPNAKGFEFADKCFVCDINNTDTIIRTLNRIKPELILPVPIGRALVAVGKLNDYWNLIGVRGKEANILTDKYQFHKTLKKYGLRNIDCHLIKRNEEINKEDFQIKFPCILKPRFGSGSREVYKLRNISDLNNLIASIEFEEDYVLEEAVEGTEYGVDGCFDEGEFHLILLRKKIITDPPAQQCVAYLSDEVDAFKYEKVKKLFQNISNVLGIKNGLMHADLIINDETLFIIEMSLRPSGHYLHNIFTPHVTGVDMVEEFIKKSLGNRYDFTVFHRKNSIIHYFDYKNEMIVKIPSMELLNEYLVTDCKINFEAGDYFNTEIKDGSVTKRGYFIIDSNEKLLSLSERVLGLFIHDSV